MSEQQPVGAEDEATALIRSSTPLRTASALARTILELIARGDLAVGTRLPTVRRVAEALDMSPSSVAQAWRSLATRHVIETRRRGGTTIVGPPMAPRAARFDRMMRSSVGLPVDIGNLNADPTLFPRVRPAVLDALDNAKLNTWIAEPITAELRAAVEPTWPFATDYFLATHGGVDAMELALTSLVGPGDRVIIESPTLARALDILDAIGATAIPVDYREDGPDLRQLEHALASRPTAMLYQPSGNSPIGHSVSEQWLTAAADLLRPSQIPIIEIVQAPFLRQDPVRSLGMLLPQQVAHAQSFNYFYGADLRVGVVGGANEIIDRMWLKLTYSSRWVSRLLQNAMAFQLSDATALHERDLMVSECARRQSAFTNALIEAGFELEPQAGPSIWLPVPDEHSVCTRMSRSGVAVHPGSMFQAVPGDSQFVHLNGTALESGFDEMAHLLAQACRLRPDSSRIVLSATSD
jgi:DNA-binding transcriptional MocR family regulator